MRVHARPMDFTRIHGCPCGSTGVRASTGVHARPLESMRVHRSPRAPTGVHACLRSPCVFTEVHARPRESSRVSGSPHSSTGVHARPRDFKRVHSANVPVSAVDRQYFCDPRLIPTIASQFLPASPGLTRCESAKHAADKWPFYGDVLWDSADLWRPSDPRR